MAIARIFSFPLFFCLGAGFLAYAGTLPDHYLRRVMGSSLPQPYPWRTVLFSTLFFAGEMTVLFLLLRPLSFVWQISRSFGAFLCSFACASFYLITSMHAPPVHIYHLLLEMVLVLIFFLLFVIAIVRKMIREK